MGMKTKYIFLIKNHNITYIKEIEFIVKNLPTTKTPGTDSSATKHFGGEIIPVLHNIFGKQKRGEYFPFHLMRPALPYYWSQVKMLNQVRSPTHSKPNTEMPRFAAEEGLMHRAAKRREQISNPPPWMQEAQGIYRIKLVGGEHGERWLELTKRWNNCSAQVQWTYMLLHGTHVQKVAATACSQGGAPGPLTSKGYRTFAHAQVGDR